MGRARCGTSTREVEQKLASVLLIEPVHHVQGETWSASRSTVVSSPCRWSACNGRLKGLLEPFRPASWCTGVTDDAYHSWRINEIEPMHTAAAMEFTVTAREATDSYMMNESVALGLA